MKKLKAGVVGFGGRGVGITWDILSNIEKLEITAVCDLYQDRMDNICEKLVEEKGCKRPLQFADYHDLVLCDEVDVVFVLSAWESHVPIAVFAMENNKPVGLEVGGAYSIEQCWDLVRTYEKTQTPVMLLENCCYGRREMLVLNMVKKGLFGEVVHCSGGYLHDLRKEVAFGEENRHYRLRNYLNRNCENYPTHELGPIAKVLDINHGNRMLSLVSMASKSAGLHEYIRQEKGADDKLLKKTFAQGDIVTTIIKCANGETITLTLDTTLPRYYSRGFTVRGTKAMYEESTDSIFVDPQPEEKHMAWKEEFGNVEKFFEEHDHPVWKEYLDSGVQGGHDGMDWLVYNAFVDSIVNGTPCPIDVYDTASWMCITALSEESIMKGSAPVAIPDFTNGMWTQR